MGLVRAMQDLLVPSTRELPMQHVRAPVVGPQMQTRVLGWNNTLMAEWDAELAIRKAYLANVVVYRCVQIIAETLASLPFRAGLNPDEPEDFDVDAPLARLLGPPPGGPNPDTGAYEMWSHAVAQWIVTGRFGWELEWSGKPGRSEVVALWPLISQYLRPVPTTDQTATEYPRSTRNSPSWFVGYEYVTPLMRNKRLSADQVFYHWLPSQRDWHQPESPLQAARLDVSCAVMMNIYDEAFLANNSMPAAIVVTQEFANQEQKDAFKAQFAGSYGGPRNAGKLAFATADTEDGNVSQTLDVKTLGLSQKDAQFFERYRQKVASIAIALGVPMSKLDASDRTFSNAGEEDETYELNTIIPLAKRFQEAINIRLAPLVGREVGWFDLSGLKITQESRESKAFVQVSPIDAWSAGVISLNECRDVLGQSRSEDVAADTIGALDKSERPEPTSVEDMPKEIEPAPPVEDPERTRMQTIERRDVEPVVSGEERRDLVRSALLPVLDTLETQWVGAFRALFDRQKATTLSRLSGKRGRQWLKRASEAESIEADEIFDQEFWTKETEETSEVLYLAVIAAAIARMGGEVPVDLPNASDPILESILRSRSSRLADQVTETTYETIRETMIAGVAAGETIDEIAERVQAVFEGASRSRALLIARTEVSSAYNEAVWTIARSLGDIVGGLEWVAVDDDVTRPDHREADGQVVGMGELFDVGGHAMRFPGDPLAPPEEVCNCRCGLGLLTPEEVEASRSLIQWRRVDEVEAELMRIALVAA